MRPLFARLAFACLLLIAATIGMAATARANPTYVDKRVSALPRAALLEQPARALVDPRRQRAAERLRRYLGPLFFLWALAQIGALYATWSSGSAARLRDLLRRRISLVFVQRFVYGATLTCIAAIAAFPVALLRFRLEYSFELSHELAPVWYRDFFLTTALDAIVVGAVVACVFALVDRTRLWYAYAMAGLFFVTLAMAVLEPLVVAPFFNHFESLAIRNAVRTPLAKLAERAGVGDAPILVADTSLRSPAVTADIAGFGPTRRIVLSDALLTNATLGEVLFLSAREFGHYAHGDDFRLSLFWTTLFIVATAVAVLCADRIRVRRDDDPLARLALVFAFLGVFGVALAPIYNGYSRNLESRADAYAIALTNDRSAAIRAFVRIADETLAPICPTRITYLYFWNSPAIGARIAKVARRPNPCR